MSAAALGGALVVLGVAGTTLWVGADLRRGCRELRRAGRAALVAPRAAVRLVRRGPPAVRCARRGHLPSFDGLYESCRRCGASSRPFASLDDPRLAPPGPVPPLPDPPFPTGAAERDLVRAWVRRHDPDLGRYDADDPTASHR